MRIAWLGEPESFDPATVGGKTANLGRLAASFRVPPGFCLDASVHARLGAAQGGDARARAELHGLVSASYADLARRLGLADPRVAVRSSAIGEDSGDASFAGQFETYLNISGAAAVVDAVLDCWRSASSERARAYRRERGITAPTAVAVLVQRMVDPEISAIAFSADPVSGARDVVVVNAARGLGDAIASGEMTPDSFSVRKSDLTIADRRIASEEPIDDRDVIAIARLANQLEAAMGWPVDIECAIARGETFLLQCRPITTLREAFPVTWNDPADAKLTWTREDAHFDRVFGPLASDFITNGPDHGIRARGTEVGSPLIVRHEPFNGRFYVSARPRDPSADLPTAMTAATLKRRALARTLRHDWDETLLPEVRAHYAWMSSVDLGSLSPAGAAEAWLEVWRRMNRIWTIHFVVTGAAYPVMEELAQAYESLTGRRGHEVLVVTQGLAPTLQALERDLLALTDAARGATHVADALARGERSLDALAALPGGALFAEEVARFLDEHGDIGQETLDVSCAAWRDDPAKLMTILAQRISAPHADPDARAARVRAEADVPLARARAVLRDRPADLARFEEILAAAISAGPLTEEHNYWIDRVSQAYGYRVALSAGERLARDGALRAAEDVFLLYVHEIADALRAPRPLEDLVARRRRELAEWRRLAAPKTIGAPPTAPEPTTPGNAAERTDFEHRVAQDDVDVLKGVGASSGTARGPARVVTGPDDFSKVRPGDVIVCRQSTVSWVPLYTIAAAVVTEIGASLSHAAVVAREFGIPAVVACGGALALTDGEPLEVDGTAGVVRRLFPFAWTDPEDATIVWRRDDAHAARASVRKPLAIDYTLYGASYGLRKRDEMLGLPVLNRFGAFNGRLYNSSKPLRPPDEMARHHAEAQSKRRQLARRIRRDWNERYLPQLDAIYEWMSAVDPSVMSADEAAEAWDELWRRHRRAWQIHMIITAGSYTVMDEIGQLYRELELGPATEAFALTQGLAHSLQRMERDLADLTERARRAPALGEAIAHGGSPDGIRAIDRGFTEALDAFLALHGDNGQSAEGLGALAWADDPSLLVGAIAIRLARPPEDPDARLARLRANANGIARRARERLAARPDDLVRFEEVLAAATSAGPLTEEHNYWLDRRNQARMGRAARRFGARLVADGTLRDPEEIFLLYVREVRDVLRRPRDLTSLVAERVAEQRRWLAMDSPETLGTPPVPWQKNAGTTIDGLSHLLFKETQSDPARVLRGVGASAGVARGPARLVRDLASFGMFAKGDVLVCQSSNVSWIPLFVNAAAVVTEVGGALSHAAVVAREFGVPAVVGTGIALTTLVDGEPLEVDGSAGMVRRLGSA